MFHSHSNNHTFLLAILPYIYNTSVGKMQEKRKKKNTHTHKTKTKQKNDKL